MWKLIATALAIADSGSMSVSSIATDFANRPACEAASRELFSGTIERELAGRRVTIRTAGQCVPIDGLPPPVAVDVPVALGPPPPLPRVRIPPPLGVPQNYDGRAPLAPQTYGPFHRFY